MFKVVPDQLRISQGWVRCGKCEEVFDASAHLQEGAAQDVIAAANDGPDTVPFEGAAQDFVATEATEQQAVSGGTPAPALEASSGTAVGGLDFELKEPVASLVPAMEPAVPSTWLPVEHSTDGVAPAAAAAKSVTAAEVAPRAREPEAADAVAELSFMRDAKRASRWHRPLVRATLMVLCLLLLAGLAGQFMVHERDRIAAIEPALKPLLEDVCLLLDCRVGPLRQIESVVIDSSAFSKTKGDVYRLSLNLKNTAPIDLAMPAVELALTDTLDQPLLRRVLRPEELGVKSGVIPAASETQTTLVLTIKTNGNGERVAGYRLLAFYP
jgi:predicted Zn finger-like uncharacterized protein